MGAEQNCRLRLNGLDDEGIAQCGDGEITFRGAERFRWKWTDLSSIGADDGVLTLRCGADCAMLFLGDAAEKWQYAILNPKLLLDKLGIKADMSVHLAGEFDAEFRRLVSERAGEATETSFDCVCVQMDATDQLSTLREARKGIKDSGMIWAVWPKGRQEFNENHIREFALGNGLVDVKVAKFSEELSALKLVIPVKLRGR